MTKLTRITQPFAPRNQPKPNHSIIQIVSFYAVRGSLSIFSLLTSVN